MSGSESHEASALGAWMRSAIGHASMLVHSANFEMAQTPWFTVRPTNTEEPRREVLLYQLLRNTYTESLNSYTTLSQS